MRLFLQTFVLCQTLSNLHAAFGHPLEPKASSDPASKTNVAMYWGQGPNQQRLLHYCQQSTVDIIPIGFVHIFPGQGNGFPGTNFGNQCSGGSSVYRGPGNDQSKDSLQAACPQINADIPVCQTVYQKKIILSLGGGTNGYQLTGTSAGVAFADFLWGAFGPKNSTWVSAGNPRPFDGPDGEAVEVDGFDFDIEQPSTDDSAGYIAMINRLRTLYEQSTKPKLITGSPQCVAPDANMAVMIQQAQFDILWIQYFNTAQCSARNWVNANPSYSSNKVEQSSDFSYNAWASFLAGTKSENAKIYIGLAGATNAAIDPSFYITPAQASDLIRAYFCKMNFGGIMIWEATYAEANMGPGGTYYQNIKSILNAFSMDESLSCYSVGPSSTAPVMSTTISMPSASKSSSATLSTTKSSFSSSAALKTSSRSSTTSVTSRTISSPSSKKTPAGDGTCGGSYGDPCRPGYCCSKWGYCGSAPIYCEDGCQIAFGICS